MSEPKDFLSRWSERKRNPEPEKSAPEAKDVGLPSDANSADISPAAVPEFDISTLPPLESIMANSDVRAFLQRGVPAELTRAALRRAWSADPAIRDFIGLSENAWDFNKPDSIPGFGSLSAEDVRRAVLQFVQGSKTEGRAVQESDAAKEEISAPASDAQAQLDSDADSSDATVPETEDNVALQQDAEDETITSARQQRRHGSALPK